VGRAAERVEAGPAEVVLAVAALGAADLAEAVVAVAAGALEVAARSVQASAVGRVRVAAGQAVAVRAVGRQDRDDGFLLVRDR